MKFELEDVILILNNETKWCIDNPDKAFHREYRKGFINGLIQAKYLISELMIIAEPKDEIRKTYDIIELFRQMRESLF